MLGLTKYGLDCIVCKTSGHPHNRCRHPCDQRGFQSTKFENPKPCWRYRLLDRSIFVYYTRQMSNISDSLTDSIASRVRIERESRNWSLASLAEESGVSKAMISKIERGESSPTTNMLGRLCGAFGLTLSTFLTRAEGKGGNLIRAEQQATWTDAETGMVRRLVSPNAGGPIEIVSIELPAGTEITFPASIYAVFQQTIWVLSGQLSVTEDTAENLLKIGQWGHGRRKKDY